MLVGDGWQREFWRFYSSSEWIYGLSYLEVCIFTYHNAVDLTLFEKTNLIYTYIQSVNWLIKFKINNKLKLTFQGEDPTLWKVVNEYYLLAIEEISTLSFSNVGDAD